MSYLGVLDYIEFVSLVASSPEFKFKRLLDDETKKKLIIMAEELRTAPGCTCTSSLEKPLKEKNLEEENEEGNKNPAGDSQKSLEGPALGELLSALSVNEGDEGADIPLGWQPTPQDKRNDSGPLPNLPDSEEASEDATTGIGEPHGHSNNHVVEEEVHRVGDNGSGKSDEQALAFPGPAAPAAAVPGGTEGLPLGWGTPARPKAVDPLKLI